MGNEDSPLVIVRARGPSRLVWVPWNPSQMRGPCRRMVELCFGIYETGDEVNSI